MEINDDNTIVVITTRGRVHDNQKESKDSY